MSALVKVAACAAIALLSFDKAPLVGAKLQSVEQNQRNIYVMQSVSHSLEYARHEALSNRVSSEWLQVERSGPETPSRHGPAWEVRVHTGDEQYALKIDGGAIGPSTNVRITSNTGVIVFNPDGTPAGGEQHVVIDSAAPGQRFDVVVSELGDVSVRSRTV